jgi:RHS repeat-associated protein
MVMNNRKYTGPAGAYRFGFNGKENDKETVNTGEGTQDYGLRIYNPAIGRFLSVDPLAAHYSYKTPYDFAENDVISHSDLDGGEKNLNTSSTYQFIVLNENGTTTIKKLDKPVFGRRTPNEIDWGVAKKMVQCLGLPPEGSGNLHTDVNGVTTMDYFFHAGETPMKARINVNQVLDYIAFQEAQTLELLNAVADGVKLLIDLYLMSEPIFIDTFEEGASAPKTTNVLVRTGKNFAADVPIVEITRAGGRLAQQVGEKVEMGATSISGYGSKLLTDLGIKDGMKVTTSKALELALNFLGEGYKEVGAGSGRYLSADGTRVVRIGVNDITGKHGGGPHVNFETLTPNADKPGKMKVDENIHVYLSDEK